MSYKKVWNNDDNIMIQKQKSNTTAIVPCFNDGLFIIEALNSLLNQTLLPEKIIIIDDGSGEETLKILREIQSPIVQIIYQENTGVCTARNRAINKVTTEYILTLDADDYFEPTFLEKAFEVISQCNQIAMVCCYYRKFYESIKKDEVIKPVGGNVNSFLVKNNGIASGLFKKKSWVDVEGYDVNFNQGYEDWDFNISILTDTKEIFILKEVLYHYRIKNESRDQYAFEKYDFDLKIKLLEKHRDLYQNNSIDVIKHFIYNNSMLKNNVVKTKTSLEFRIGAFTLMPFRFLKNLISR